MTPCAVAEPRSGSSLRVPSWRRLSPALTLLVGAILTLAACGGGSAAPATNAGPGSPAGVATDAPSAADVASPSTAALDPCALIALPEAEAVVGGVTLADGVPAGNPVPDRCVWTAPPTASIAQVEIDVGDGAKKSYDIDHDVLSHVFTAVPGLGDEAYQEDDAIFFRVGPTWVAIHLELLNDPAANVAPLQHLAQLVAGRL